MHLSQIAKCICLKLQNAFVSNCKIYSSQIAKCLCLKLTAGYSATSAAVWFETLSKLHLFQIAKCICLKLQNVLVPDC